MQLPAKDFAGGILGFSVPCKKGISLHTNYMKGSCVQLQTTDTAVSLKTLNDFLREVSVPALVQCTPSTIQSSVLRITYRLHSAVI